jgi:hypothetical protein
VQWAGRLPMAGCLRRCHQIQRAVWCQLDALFLLLLNDTCLGRQIVDCRPKSPPVYR